MRSPLKLAAAITVTALLFTHLASTASAISLVPCFVHITEGGCNANAPQCFWAGWGRCRTCSGEMNCLDYSIRDVCQDDPCRVTSPPGGCEWAPIYGYCSSGCQDYNVLGSWNPTDCINNRCMPWRRIWGTQCVDCPVDISCKHYRDEESCNKQPCGAGGGAFGPSFARGCYWWGSKCTVDSDGDTCPDIRDNCPNVNNTDQKNRYVDKAGTCDRQGDACDDTDGDGLTDAEELRLGLNPLNVDSDSNCLTDGVEEGFDPYIEILTAIAFAFGTAMMALQGMRILWSFTPQDRASAKKGVIHIMVGLVILAGGKDLVIFVLQGTCTARPNVGYSMACTPSACPVGSQQSCPLIYAYNGSAFVREHEGYPYSVLRAWEDTSYSVLPNLRGVDGRHRLRISEEQSEVSYTDRLRLYAVDHPGGVEVYPDIHGGLHTIGEPLPPTRCVEEDGTDCLPYMRDDGVAWRSSLEDKQLSDTDDDLVIDDYREEDLYDGIILSYPKPRGQSEAKLLIKAKESGSISFAWEEIVGLVGEDAIAALDRYERSPLSNVLGSLRDEAGMYGIDVWDGTTWVKQERVGLGGVLYHTWVTPLQVPTDMETVEVRITSVVTGYETDYAFIDYSSDRPLEVREMAPSSAVKYGAGYPEDVLGLLTESDDIYLELGAGEYVEVEFTAPSPGAGDRSFLVEVEGYFLVDSRREGAGGIVDALKVLGDPDYFIRYTLPRYIQEVRYVR